VQKTCDQVISSVTPVLEENCVHGCAAAAESLQKGLQFCLDAYPLPPNSYPFPNITASEVSDAATAEGLRDAINAWSLSNTGQANKYHDASQKREACLTGAASRPQ